MSPTTSQRREWPWRGGKHTRTLTMHTTHARHSGFVQQLTKGERVERRHKLVHSERTIYGHNQQVGGLQTQVSPGFKTTSYTGIKHISMHVQSFQHISTDYIMVLQQSTSQCNGVSHCWLSKLVMVYNIINVLQHGAEMLQWLDGWLATFVHPD